MSNVVIKEDGILIKAEGVHSWFAAIFITGWVLWVFKAFLSPRSDEGSVELPILVSGSEPVFDPGTGVEIILGISCVLIFFGAGFYFMWQFIFRGFIKEEAVIQDGEFIWTWRWFFLKRVVHAPIESISDLAWHHPNSGGGCIHFRVAEKRRFKRAKNCSVDEVKNIAEHLGSLLPQGNQLSEKSLKSQRKKEKEDEVFKQELREFGATEADLDYNEAAEEEEEQRPILFGLSSTAWGRLGLVTGIIIPWLAHFYKSDWLAEYWVYTAFAVMSSVMLLGAYRSLRVTFTEKKTTNKSPAPITDNNVASAFLSFLVGSIAGYILYLVLHGLVE